MEDSRLILSLNPDGHYVDLNTFVDALGHFRRMLSSLRGLTKNDRPLEWLVTELRVGSAVAAVEPKGDLHAGQLVARTLLAGMHALEHSQMPPPAFTAETISAARNLVEATARAQVRTVIASSTQRIEVTQRTAVTATEILEVAVWEDLGTVEGSLEMINLHDRYQCNIYEMGSGRRVPCYFRAEQLETVKLALGHRVLVTGAVRYNRNGEILNVRALDFTVLPSAERLPTIDEITGIVPDISDGLTTEEHIRRLRDEH